MALVYGQSDQVQFQAEGFENSRTIYGDVAIVNSIVTKMINTYCNGFSSEKNSLRILLNGLKIHSSDGNFEQSKKAKVVLEVVDSKCIVVENEVNRDPSDGGIMTTRLLSIDLLRNHVGGAISPEHLILMKKQTRLFGSQIIMVSKNAFEATKRVAAKSDNNSNVAIYYQERRRVEEPIVRRSRATTEYDEEAEEMMEGMVALGMLFCCCVLCGVDSNLDSVVDSCVYTANHCGWINSRLKKGEKS